MTDLASFRNEDKQVRIELEEKVKTILKKFEHDDLLQFCFDAIGKEPQWRIIGRGISQEGYSDKYEPPKQIDFEDFIWDNLITDKITYKQIQDYAVRHHLVPRNYFLERKDLSSDNVALDFFKSVKSSALEKQEVRCERCGRFSHSFLFDHKDGNKSNSSSDNCQALCSTCYKRKNGITE